MKILVLGDFIWDNYIFYNATRICPEAPCPVMVYDREERRPGGAALVAENLRSLGGNEIYSWYGSVSDKTRHVVDRSIICRVDRDSHDVQLPRMAYEFLKYCPRPDAITVSDYGKGAITKEIVDQIQSDFRVPIFIDAKKNGSLWTGACASFPNEHEDAPPTLHVIRKLGPRGCEVDGVPVPCTTRQVYDVTGAGDVFMAAFVWDYLKNEDMMHAAMVANDAAGVSVEHFGTYVVRPGELHGA